MLKAYSILGFGHKALALFNLMLQNQIVVSHATICSILNACSHAGLVSEALEIYNLVQSKVSIRLNSFAVWFSITILISLRRLKF